MKFYKNYEYDELNQLIVFDSRDYQEPNSSTLTDTNFTKYYYYDTKGNITDVKTFLYGEDDYVEAIAPTGYNTNLGSEQIFVVVSGDTEIPVNGTLSLNFSYYLLDYSMPPNPVTLPMLTIKDYTLVDTTTPGYYLLEVIGKDKFGGSTYNLEFGIVITVGTPIDHERIPQQHIHYNYSSYWDDQLVSYSEIEYINGNPLPEVVLQNYSYDNQGNPTSITNFYYGGYYYDQASLTYQGRQLETITLTDTTLPTVNIAYTYNDQGYRTSKTIDGHKVSYFLQGDKVLYETDGTYGMIYTYDHDGTLISFNYDNNVNDSISGIEYFYVRNQQGDITKIIDHSGNIVVEYEYDAWGNMINWNDISSNQIAQVNPYTYRGYRYDQEINLYYLNSRYYNANLGRFINADGLLGSIGDSQTTNMYAYCANNPVMYVDRDGKFAISIFIGSIIVGAIIGGVLGGYTAIQNGTELGSQQFWIGVGTGALIGGAVGAVAGMTLAGGGAGYLIGGLSSMGNKLISDVSSSVYYGSSNFGSWEDYAVAFIIGGVISGKGLIGLSKWGLDAVARPLLNQVTKMGTRGAEFNAGRFAYDVFTRSVTIGMGSNIQAFGLELNPSKAIVRGLFSGMGRIIYD